MALQNYLFAQMLILAVGLASALASTSARDPKELRIFRLSDSPFYRVPSTQFRNGVIQRQINSPIDPLIGQQGLGPFFGYFPNFLTQPCPATPECQNCTVCPVVPKPPPAAKITTCPNKDPGIASSAENGTINLSVGNNDCKLTLTSFYPNTRVKFNCSSLTGFSGSIVPTTTSSVASGVDTLAVKTDYLSKENVLFITFISSPVTTALECSWTNVPAA
ncbi:hypothetical protein GHT06_020671 [Daphnia sinensis]|uniref:Uncharacterized protein n=1 Tax=Daphnia sinensis TaxID=1820382 RepID=A0AAD5KZ32_9CRUS|nr:hypothetical protein GHT06_020671 [Daphnia sinensis]